MFFKFNLLRSNALVYKQIEAAKKNAPITLAAAVLRWDGTPNQGTQAQAMRFSCITMPSASSNTNMGS